MEDTEKASRMVSAIDNVCDQFIAEGKPKLAKQTRAALEGVPVGSLAKLYDFFKSA